MTDKEKDGGTKNGKKRKKRKKKNFKKRGDSS